MTLPTTDPKRADASGWTDERIDRLAELWAAGWSASQIANALGWGTRNSVIGKIHRLGLSGDDRVIDRRSLSQAKRKAAQTAKARARDRERRFAGKKSVASRPRRHLRVIAPEPATSATAVTLWDRRYGQCCFPLELRDEYGIRMSCGAPIERDGAHYCRHHAAICYRLTPVTEAA